jgi:hypothetical protein
MRLTRIYADADGEACFEDLNIDLRPDALGTSSAIMPATSVFVRELREGMVNDYHCAPRRQLVLLVAGAIEVESGRGVRRMVRAGDGFLVENLTGRGHITRTIGGKVTCIYVPVPQSFDVGALCKV